MESKKVNLVVNPDFLENFDTLIGEHGYQDRSEAIREGMRLLMSRLRRRGPTAK